MRKIIFISYAFFLLLFAVFSYAFIDPNLIYLQKLFTNFAFKNRLATTFFYIIFVVIFFIFNILFVKLTIKDKLTLGNIKLLIIITVAVLLFSYPAMLSFDIFNYIATAKTLFFYHENPYIVMPIELTDDPLLLFMHAANKTALYGVSWIGLSGIPYLLGFGNFIVTLFSFKLFIFVFYLSTIFVIWKLSKNIQSVVLFAFNPLIVIETLVSGHNDIVMMFLALFSFFLVKKKKTWLAVPFFILSVFIKYSTLFLLPIFIYLLLKEYKKEKIVWDKIYLASFLLMFIAFLLAPVREEIYPWYALWFLTFIVFVKNNVLRYLSFAFSFGLLLRYIPFMFIGTYLDPTPLIKILVTFVPPMLVVIYIYLIRITKKILTNKTVKL